MTALPKPTESELEILQVLWQKNGATVREVNDFLNAQREIGYTTTLKLMQIMFEKNLLTREELGRQHLYQAAVSEADTQALLLNKFVKSTFRGSAMSLVMSALGVSEASAEELAELKMLIKKLEKQPPGPQNGE